MNVAKSLYGLQSIDIEIQTVKVEFDAVNGRLIKNERLLAAEEKLHCSKENVVRIEKSRKEMEWEVDDLEKAVKQIEQKLYGGTIKNPKELMSFEQEIKVFKEKLQQKEDLLLNLMNEEELAQTTFKKENVDIDEIKSEWDKEYPDLEKKKIQLDITLGNLSQQRENIISEIDSQALKLYDTIKQKKGQAVVKIEQGRCHRCRISLSLNELQKAKVGSLLQCSSCGLILYLS